jgi:curved DNA-binding protein CbpA
MSEETNAFTANLYINGRNVGYCKNQGHGGCTDYNANSSEDHKTIQEAEAYCKALPKTKWKDMEFDQSLESVIDQLMEDWLKAKETKKMEKRMQTCILVGSPDSLNYSYYNFKAPLSNIPKGQLEASVFRIKNKLNKGEVILNTNLKQLGITV